MLILQDRMPFFKLTFAMVRNQVAKSASLIWLDVKEEQTPLTKTNKPKSMAQKSIKACLP
jgi:hypothetical protein